MRFYENSEPKLNQITMCTVTSFNETGYSVVLNEYDREGFLMFTELSNRKIRVPLSSYLKNGTQIPLKVIDNGALVYLTKKSLEKKDIDHSHLVFGLNSKLFSLARRLSNITSYTQEQWEQQFRRKCDPEIDETEHPLKYIHDREFEQLGGDDGMDQEFLSLIEQNHVKLFGVKPITQRYKFTVYSFQIHGMEQIKTILIDLEQKYRPEPEHGTDVWSDDQLYECPDRCNLRILPIAIPTFQLQITAYHKKQCEHVYDQIKAYLQHGGNFKLDGLMLND